MSRIRTIKPEFCQAEKIGRLSRDARLLFIQLWTFVDDLGRCRGSSRLLAASLYPYDDDAGELIEGWLAELEAENCIRRYVVDGATYLDIPKWGKHQRIDNAGKSRLPEFRENSPRTAANDGKPPLYLGPRTRDLGPRTIPPLPPPGGERAHAKINLFENDSQNGSRDGLPSKRKLTKPRTSLPDDWALDERGRQHAQAAGFDIRGIETMARAFADHHRARGNLMADWAAAWRTWCRNEIKFSRERRARSNGGNVFAAMAADALINGEGEDDGASEDRGRESRSGGYDAAGEGFPCIEFGALPGSK